MPVVEGTGQVGEGLPQGPGKLQSTFMVFIFSKRNPQGPEDVAPLLSVLA